MKLVNKSYKRGEAGHAKLIPEEGTCVGVALVCAEGYTLLLYTHVVPLHTHTVEDMWHAYNLIRVGDHITATTFRKVQRDSGVGAESEKVKLTLKIAVEDVDFDPQGGSIRLKGRNLVENEHVKLGAYHTLELEEHRAFTINKVCVGVWRVVLCVCVCVCSVGCVCRVGCVEWGVSGLLCGLFHVFFWIA